MKADERKAKERERLRRRMAGPEPMPIVLQPKQFSKSVYLTKDGEE